MCMIDAAHIVERIYESDFVWRRRERISIKRARCITLPQLLTILSLFIFFDLIATDRDIGDKCILTS